MLRAQTAILLLPMLGSMGLGKELRPNSAAAALRRPLYWIGLLICATLLAAPLCAQPSEPSRPPLVRRISIEQGLPSSEVFALAEDESGYLWLGTDAGLVRYDGRQFVRWDAPPGFDGPVEQLLIDANDHLWFGVTERGLVELGPQREVLRSFSVASHPDWPSNDIWALEQGADGAIWVGTYLGGLLRLVGDTGSFERILIEGVDAPVSVLDLDTDSDGTLWVGTRLHGLRRLPVGSTTAIAMAQVDKGMVIAVKAAAQGLWLALQDRGVCLLDRQQTLDCALDQPEQHGLGSATAMALGSADQLWVAHRHGLSWRSANGQWGYLRGSAGSISSLPERRLMALHADTDGGLWIGTDGGGLAYLSPLAQRVDAWVADAADTSAVPAVAVTSVAADASGLWIATRERGLQRFDWETQQVSEAHKVRLSQRRIWMVASDGRDALWVSHEDGLSRLGTSAELDRHWRSEELGPGLYDLFRVLGPERLLVSVYGSGLRLLNYPSGRLEQVSADQFPPREVEDIQSAHQQIWVASEQGLHRFDPQCACLHWLGISEQRAYALAADDSGWWVAVDEVVMHLRAEGAHWRPDQTLAWRGRAPGGLWVDPSGRLWAAGPEGLAVLEKGANSWRKLAPELGLVAAELSGRPFTVQQGRLLLPSARGLLRIDPATLPTAPTLRSLRLTSAGVRRAGDWIELDARQPAVLEPDDRDFSFRMESPLLSEAQSLRLQTRIEGLDEDWVDSTDGQRVVGALDSGRYIITGRVWHPANRDQMLQVAWPLQVLAPWWQRWPAMLAAGLALLGLSAVAYRLTIQAGERRHRQLMEVEQLVWAERNAADKSAFLAHLSHEIRNPLSGLLGLLQMAESTAEGKQRSRLGLARAAGAQIQSLLEDVLVWSRVQRGDLTLKQQPVAVAEVATEVCERYRPMADDQLMPLLLRGDADLWVRADRLRLAQILDNLLGNALKFCEGGQLLLSWEAIDQDQVLIALSDEGPGISAAAARRIFEQREQAVADSRGLGLGLSIARRLALRMGGDLSLNRGGWSMTGLPPSRVGPGSRFELRLDRAQPAAAQSDRAAHFEPPLQGPPAAAGLRITGSTVLLVEDDSIQRARWVEELGARGFAISAHAHALTALSEISRSAPAALITDLGLAEVDGLQLIRLLRAQPALAQLPILVLTARALPADQAAALEAGADQVMQKPAQPEAVAEWIEASIRRRAGSP